MIEFINLVRWLLFVMPFISRSLGEVNAWLSLRCAHWRISALLFPMCVWGMCACMRVHWSNEPLPQKLKRDTHPRTYARKFLHYSFSFFSFHVSSSAHTEKWKAAFLYLFKTQSFWADNVLFKLCSWPASFQVIQFLLGWFRTPGFIFSMPEPEVSKSHVSNMIHLALQG